MPYTKAADRTYLNQFIPQSLLHLTQTKKIKYKNVNLKTDFIIHMINMCICKYYFTKKEIIEKEITIPLSSLILKDIYGVKYKHYMDYLINVLNFIYMDKNYYNGGTSGGRCRRYKIKWNYLINITRVKIYDTILLNKYKKEHLIESTTKHANSPIHIDVRKKVVNDLYTVELDYNSSIKLLDELKVNGLDQHKYYKNWITLKKLEAGEIFYKFDEYGRLHTNFTTLKREIRKNFIKINSEDVYEFDIPNSQPLFLAVLIKKTLPLKQLINAEFQKYFDLVNNGLIYEYLMKKCSIKKREDVKDMMYKVLFGKNGEVAKQNKMFASIFPDVFNFIVTYKIKNSNHKSVSHDLQKMESEFIFNSVIKRIIDTNPEIPLFTIHDSIVVPLKYKKTVQTIFDYYKRNLL